MSHYSHIIPRDWSLLVATGQMNPKYTHCASMRLSFSRKWPQQQIWVWWPFHIFISSSPESALIIYSSDVNCSQSYKSPFKPSLVSAWQTVCAQKQTWTSLRLSHFFSPHLFIPSSQTTTSKITQTKDILYQSLFILLKHWTISHHINSVANRPSCGPREAFLI